MDDGPLFGAIGIFSSALLCTVAILILAPPFLTSLNAEPLHLAHTPAKDGWSFIAADARFLEEYPGIIPPGTETAFLRPGAVEEPLPLRISGERTRIEIREDSPVSKTKSVALLSDLLRYSGKRHMAGRFPPDGGKGIPVYLSVEKPEDPGTLPVYISGKTFFLSSLAKFVTVREVLYLRRWSGSRW